MGISGSDPLHDGYGRFKILNRAAIFFIDTLMFEISIQEKCK